MRCPREIDLASRFYFPMQKDGQKIKTYGCFYPHPLAHRATTGTLKPWGGSLQEASLGAAALSPPLSPSQWWLTQFDPWAFCPTPTGFSFLLMDRADPALRPPGMAFFPNATYIANSTLTFHPPGVVVKGDSRVPRCPSVSKGQRQNAQTYIWHLKPWHNG